MTTDELEFILRIYFVQTSLLPTGVIRIMTS